MSGVPYKLGVFNYEFWALKVLPPPWPPRSKECKIVGLQKGATCPSPQGAAKLHAVKLLVFEKNQKGS